MNFRNIDMLTDTLAILKQGYYTKDGKQIKLKLTQAQMEEISVYLPRDIKNMETDTQFEHIHMMGRVGVSCENADSFSLALRRSAAKSKELLPVLVLNLANPVNPGGGVRRGARAQEEDLCRKSSLLLSLESDAAQEYYNYNKALRTYMGSDAIMITPRVEIIKDETGELLPESAVVSVMTCAAPMVTYGKEGMTEEAYEAMVYHRIQGMLTVAAWLGYKNLVLGAFGCGAFDNDAKVVSDLFYRAMKDFNRDGMALEDCFRRIDFAVLDRSSRQYNFKHFARNFNDFYREEDNAETARAFQKIKATEIYLDRIRGSLFGGAVGDALGYSIEFESEKEIFSTYGKAGITEYVLSKGKALISDDTQMTLFTAAGLLVGETRACLRGIGSNPGTYVAGAYYDWLKTQKTDIRSVNRNKRYTKDGGYTWLLDVPELYALRAPGMTCLSALESREERDTPHDFIAAPINNSKGCGGIMRIAPLPLKYRPGENFYGCIEVLDMEVAQIAAITHSHSLGYMPAAVASHIISRCITSAKEMSLKEMVLEARDAARKLFAGDKHLQELTDIIDRAVRLSENEASDLDNIHALGEGWVAEETLAIALYCSLKYSHDFSKAIITAVNHKGDSDSTGAVTGNILGALLGYSAIEEKWKENLELADVILEVADDLCHGCQMSEYGYYRDPVWLCKYVEMHRYPKTETD